MEIKGEKNKKERVVIVVIILSSFFILSLIFLQLRAKSTVESFLEKKFPSHLTLNYDELDVNLITGDIKFSNVDLKIRDRDTTLNHTLIKINNVLIDRLSYWHFFLRNTIKAKRVLVESPYASYYPSKTFREKSQQAKGVVNLLKKISIGKIKISNGSFDMGNQQNDSIRVRVRKMNFSLLNGKTDPKIIQRKIPITYDSYNFSSKDLFVDLGLFETVNVEALMITETNAKLTNLVLQSKYSKAELSKMLRKERDHIDLKVPEFSLSKIDFGYQNNRFFFASKIGRGSGLNLNIYRDKLMPDDPSHKEMYSSVLRELPFNLKIDSVALIDSEFRYEENAKSDSKAGSLYLEGASLKLQNLCNTYSKGNQTSAQIAGKLMGVAPINVSYSFDMNDKNDSFKVATTLFGLNGKEINTFLRPNVNVQIKGKVNELYFTAFGNSRAAKGDMKMKYEDLEFQILKKDKLSINKLLSAIGNLFINDGSDADAQGYRYGNIDVERDPSKSIFNYFWACTQDGIISTLTGDGEKEESKK